MSLPLFLSSNPPLLSSTLVIASVAACSAGDHEHMKGTHNTHRQQEHAHVTVLASLLYRASARSLHSAFAARQ